MTEKITLGISTCLLGESVRYDGGHKLDRFLRDILGKYVRYVPVCPEVECGLPIPREAMHLVGDIENPRLVTVRTDEDMTERMQRWGKSKLKALEEEDMCGYIFKSKSPSSGMERIKVYTGKGVSVKRGTGLWARMFIDHFPLLPVEDEGRLNDIGIRENFIERIFVYRRWKETISKGRKPGNLVAFHTTHKLLIMSHSVELYRALGKLVASGKCCPVEELYDRYIADLSNALKLKTTIKKNVNVLHHIMGYFKKQLSGDEKKELLEIINKYSGGYIPLIVPVTLFNHYVRKYDQSYLKHQYYLHPHPLELKLRNHA